MTKLSGTQKKRKGEAHLIIIWLNNLNLIQKRMMHDDSKKDNE